jgi:hypothetical protein
MEHDIVIEDDGTVRFIYADDVAEMFEGEVLRTARASHVEPFGQGWIADMRPSGGPVLFDTNTTNPIGRVAFKTRQAALDAERAWLQQERGL